MHKSAKIFILIFVLIFLFGCIQLPKLGGETKEAEPATKKAPTTEKPGDVNAPAEKSDKNVSEQPKEQKEIQVIETPEKNAVVAEPAKDACADIKCGEYEQCVKGKCLQFGCTQLNGYSCDKNSTCFVRVYPAYDSKNCCAKPCETKDFQITLGKLPGDNVPHLRYLDKSNFYHEIPFVIKLKPIGESGDFESFLFDNYKTYYYKADPKDSELKIKDGDILNGAKATFQYLRRGADVIIANSQPANPPESIKISGITYSLSFLAVNDWAKLIYRAKLQICEDMNCNRAPTPIQDFMNKTVYMHSGEILQQTAPHIILLGKGNARFGYLPVVIENDKGSFFFLIFDNQGYLTHFLKDNSKLKFLGSDKDGDKRSASYEPNFFAVSDPLFSELGYGAGTMSFTALFEIEKPDGKKEIIATNAGID